MTKGGNECPDPEYDPFRCSICGRQIGELKRFRGPEHCESCLREYGPAEATLTGSDRHV